MITIEYKNKTVFTREGDKVLTFQTVFTREGDEVLTFQAETQLLEAFPDMLRSSPTYNLYMQKNLKNMRVSFENEEGDRKDYTKELQAKIEEITKNPGNLISF